MKSKQRTEFGDFQTPTALAEAVCRLLRRRGVPAASIVEPTCGEGSFLCAAVNAFSQALRVVGTDIDPAYVAAAAARMRDFGIKAEVFGADFFATDWQHVLAPLPEPILVVGNPPWVCNSELSAIHGSNLPEKTNANGTRGIEALTGKSNFDVSEWMIVELLAALQGRAGTIAMLCKTSVARRVLLHAARNELELNHAAIYRIDAQQSFGAAVDACLLLIEVGQGFLSCDCQVYANLEARVCQSQIGVRDGRLIADAAAYDRWRHLFAGSKRRWRSGIKHDCAKVMELRREGHRYRNGLGDFVDLESEFLFPMLKSSQLSKSLCVSPDRWMIVPQQFVGEATEDVGRRAAKTWRYLVKHGARLDRRASSIYRNKPRFSVFGVGPYSFSPWKVAISGLYKSLKFTPVGPHGGKPVVFDDTCYFLPCDSRDEATQLATALNGPAAREVFSALIFWDAKRPITAEILNLVDAMQLAKPTAA